MSDKAYSCKVLIRTDGASAPYNVFVVQYKYHNERGDVFVSTFCETDNQAKAEWIAGSLNHVEDYYPFHASAS